jgi:hypothetical protein
MSSHSIVRVFSPRGRSYEMTIPVEDVAYAACKRPTQNDQPGVHPDRGSKEVKTYSAL